MAIPHARVAELWKPFGLFARTKKPIAFDAIDGQPVDLIFLLLLPANPEPEHLQALASVARVLRNPELVRKLRSARAGAQAYQCIIDASR